MWEFIKNNILEILALAIDVVLTGIIIFQSYKINKKTVMLQKKQIQTELLPYRKEVFRAAYRIVDFASALKQINLIEIMQEKSSDEIRKIFEITRATCGLNNNDAVISLLESKFILEESEFNEIEKIKQSYENICAYYITLSSKVFPEEMECSELFLDSKKKLLGKIYFETEQILGKADFVESKLLKNRTRIKNN